MLLSDDSAHLTKEVSFFSLISLICRLDGNDDPSAWHVPLARFPARTLLTCSIGCLTNRRPWHVIVRNLETTIFKRNHLIFWASFFGSFCLDAWNINFIELLPDAAWRIAPKSPIAVCRPSGTVNQIIEINPVELWFCVWSLLRL